MLFHDSLSWKSNLSPFPCGLQLLELLEPGGGTRVGRHAQVAAFLAIQEKEAQWWRDASIAYFQTFSKRPLPAGEPAPPHSLAYYQALQFPFAPGDGK